MAHAKNVRGTKSILQRFYDTLREECVPAIETATVTLVAIQNEKIVHDRTGVLYQVAGQHFILSASHVGQDGDHELCEILNSKIVHCVSVNTKGVLPIPLVAPAQIHGTEVNGRDIAVIHLPQDVATQIASHKRFITHNELLVADGDRSLWYVIVGYPMEWSLQKLDDDFIYSDPLIYLCNEYSGQVDPDLGHDRDVHLLLDFNRNAIDVTDRQQTLLPAPLGISGCGVWRVADYSREGLKTVSKEKLSLVGIQNRWNPRRNYVRATRIEWVLRRILDDYPELERPMKLVYPRNTHAGRIVVPHTSLR